MTVTTINEIDIQIFDEDNNLVDFNNLDWNMTLVITTEIKADHQEITLNTLLNNYYLDSKPQEEDITIEDKNNTEIPQPKHNKKKS